MHNNSIKIRRGKFELLQGSFTYVRWENINWKLDCIKLKMYTTTPKATIKITQL
jgi:hypothetical protein